MTTKTTIPAEQYTYIKSSLGPGTDVGTAVRKKQRLARHERVFVY